MDYGTYLFILNNKNPSFIMPTTHTGPCKHRNNKLCAISSNAPKRLPSNKSKIVKLNDNIFNNEMLKSKQNNEKLNLIIRKK